MEKSPKFNKKGAPKNQVTSIEELKLNKEKAFAEAEEQLEILKVSLQDLAHRIEEEKPDVLVFLDMSARMFGTPYLKYLRETMGDRAPSVRFYNDQELKGQYLAHESVEDVANRDFEDLKGKKVFFIDETFSTGKGAGALEEAFKVITADMQYFALSKNPDPKFRDELGLSSVTQKERMDEILKNPNIVVYDNPIATLFSRNMRSLYVRDWQGATTPLPRRSKDKEEKKNTIPSANSFYAPPPGMTMEEYEKEEYEITQSLVREVKDKIYDTLKDGPPETSE